MEQRKLIKIRNRKQPKVSLNPIIAIIATACSDAYWADDDKKTEKKLNRKEEDEKKRLETLRRKEENRLG